MKGRLTPTRKKESARMQHLIPVGLSEDGKNLVLASDAGEEYVVPIDHRLRVALKADNGRHGQVEMKMESALRPRDIQARIRAGESAEDVAAAAQTTLEAIMPFAGPVLAERAHVAQTALKASIRRRTSETSPAARTLDDASRQYLSAVSVRADDVAWDAWRRDDGRWSLVALYVIRGTEHRASFTYDQPGRYVVADDDTARLLTGESVAVAEEPTPERRLSSVPSGDDELPLGDDAIELVRGPQPIEQLSAVEHTEAQPSFDDLAADHADADWIAELPLEADEPEPEPASFVEPVGTPDPAREIHEALVEPIEASAPAHETDESFVEPVETPEPEHEHESDQHDEPTEKPRKKGRSSVPSWDEIMFGGGGGRD